MISCCVALGQNTIEKGLPDPAATTGSITAADSASTTPASLISGQSLITGTPTANSTVSAVVSGASSYAIQLSGTWTATVQFEKSVDAGTTWVSLGVMPVGGTTAITTLTGAGANANAVVHANGANITNVRVRCTSYTSGTASVRIQPSYGTNSVSASQAAPPWQIKGTPWSASKYTSQTTTVQTVTSAAGTFGGYHVGNPNSSAEYIQVFDTTGSVTLGTTAPTWVFMIPANDSRTIEFTHGLTVSNGIKFACTTTETGSTAPSTGLTVDVLFK